MKHFTIFQGFYYAIAEMTEEEIVSTIGSFTYREKVEEIRRIFAEQGEKAANEKKKELPAIAFSASYRGRRTKVNLVKYLGHIVIDIDHLKKNWHASSLSSRDAITPASPLSVPKGWA